MVLSEAFDQVGKNASKIMDYATVEASTEKALAAAQTAMRLDPHLIYARMKVAGLQDKLVRLASRRKP